MRITSKASNLQRKGMQEEHSAHQELSYNSATQVVAWDSLFQNLPFNKIFVCEKRWLLIKNMLSAVGESNSIINSLGVAPLSKQIQKEINETKSKGWGVFSSRNSVCEQILANWVQRALTLRRGQKIKCLNIWFKTTKVKVISNIICFLLSGQKFIDFIVSGSDNADASNTTNQQHICSSEYPDKPYLWVSFQWLSMDWPSFVFSSLFRID